MKNTKKTNLSDEHIRKIKHRFDYIINESPKYQRLVGDDEEFKSNFEPSVLAKQMAG